MSRAFTGIVLAGGVSSRMGRDKAMLLVDGRMLLDTAIARLRDAGASTVLVSGDRPSHGGIPDRAHGLGPVGGLASVLPHCADGAALVMPVDMPRFDVDAMHALLDALNDSRAACFAMHPLPCSLRIDATTRACIESVVASSPDGASVRAVHRALGGVELAMPNPQTFANINTPSDWEAVS